MKQLILTLLLITATLFLTAQTSSGRISPGSKWHYASSSSNGSLRYYFYYYYVGDLVIGGKTFQIVRGTMQQREVLSWGPPAVYSAPSATIAEVDKHFYTSNDSVYCINVSNNKLEFVWKRNPSLDDRWNLGVFSPNGSTVNVCARITQMSLETLNGQETKNLKATSVNCVMSSTDQVINEIPHLMNVNSKYGPIYGMNYINLDKKVRSSSDDTGILPNNLICYEATNFPVYLVFGYADCYNQFFTLGTEELIGANAIAISPNPFTNQLFISSMQEVKKLQLFDVLGKQVKIEVQGNVVFTETNLPSGMYFLKAQLRNGSVVTQKVLRE